MNREKTIIKKFGFKPNEKHREEIISMLKEEIQNEPILSNHDELRLLCYLLFYIGKAQDCEIIWKAKMQNMDTGCMIDSEFLCGAGYEETIEYLKDKPELKKLKEQIINISNIDLNKQDYLDEMKQYYS